MRNLDTEVKYFDQDSYGVPPLESSWGSLVEFLDKVLVLGSDFQDILNLSAVQDPEEDFWRVTLLLNSIHGFKPNLSVIELVGSESSPELNTVHRVQEVTENTVTFLLDKKIFKTKPLDNLPTEVLKLRLAPLGYTKVFEEPQKAVYKSSNDNTKSSYLRVDNSCPVGYDPSFFKFARVSMFSSIESLEDYNFKLGRLKAPSNSSNYNSAEEGMSSLWIHSISLTEYHYFRPGREEGFSPAKYLILGDSDTFYLYINKIFSTNSSNLSDILYTFGNYDKNMYLDDPQPSLLYSSNPYPGTDHYLDYRENPSFLRTETSGKYLFNSDFNDNFTSQDCDSWSPWLPPEYFLTGYKSRISFAPFKNDLNFNLFPKYIRSHRREGIFLEGTLRGYHDFIVDFQDTPSLAPKNNDVITSNSNKYLVLYLRGYSFQGNSFAISLQNWSVA